MGGVAVTQPAGCGGEGSKEKRDAELKKYHLQIITLKK